MSTYPEFVLIVKRIEELDDVAVVTFSQDVNLHHVVFQLLLTFCLNHFGCSQNPSLLVTGLQKTDKTFISMSTSHFRPFKQNYCTSVDSLTTTVLVENQLYVFFHSVNYVRSRISDVCNWVTFLTFPQKTSNYGGFRVWLWLKVNICLWCKSKKWNIKNHLNSIINISTHQKKNPNRNMIFFYRTTNSLTCF